LGQPERQDRGERRHHHRGQLHHFGPRLLQLPAQFPRRIAPPVRQRFVMFAPQEAVGRDRDHEHAAGLQHSHHLGQPRTVVGQVL